MPIKKQQLELDMEQWTGSKLGKEYEKAAYCHLAYLMYMWSTSYEMPDWMNHKLESRLIHTGQQRRHRHKEKSFGVSGRRGWDDWRE